MRKAFALLLSIAALLILAPAAFADAGSPGSTYPEQPGTSVQNACAAVNTNPGSGVGGTAGQHISPTAGAIVAGLITDACG
jgi:hypothetical protein